jgi:hypothetical protein
MSQETPRPWTPVGRVAFRFLFSYLVLFFFPFPQGLVKPYWLGDLFAPVWERLVPWLAGMLRIDLPATSAGSGDSTFEYVRVLLMVLIAAVATPIWSVVDRRRPDYRTLHAWSRIWMRYALALAMLTYGVVKVVMLQFEPPGYGRLVQQLGEFSPMAFLWTFMGTSPLYTSFTGATEVLGGVLLLSRRTTTLGALVVAGVMTNVVVLNASYDVCVKLGSMHLLFLALVLLAPDVPRLVDFFVRNRPAAPSDLGPRWQGRTLVAARWVQAFAIVAGLGYLAWDTVESYERQTAAREKPPVAPEGSYRVAAFLRDGVEVAPPALDEVRWLRVSLRNGVFGLRGRDGSQHRFRVEGDPRTGPVTLYPLDASGKAVEGAPEVGTLRLSLAGDGKSATLTGTFHGHPIEATLERQNREDFPLTSRGFRWIIEEPYFR